MEVARRSTARPAPRGHIGRRLLSWAALLALSSSLSTATAQVATPISLAPAPQIAANTDLAQALARRGDLVLRGATLDAALFTINELWNVNIVAGQVEGEVHGVFKDAPLREILDTILLGNGYGYRLVGESIVVSRLEQLGQINPFFISAALPVTNVAPSTLVDAVGLLSTPQGKVQAVDSARSLIVVDFPERVKMIRELAASIDAASGGGAGAVDANGRPRPLEVGYFHTQYIRIEDAKKVLAPVLSTIGRAESIEGEDRLIVVDYPDNLQMVRRVLEQVDRPRPQVQITALIYDLSLEDAEQLGINWGSAFHARPDANGDPQTVISADSILQAPFGPNATGSTFTFFNVSTNFDLNAVVLAMQSADDSRLLANPNVTVMDNEKAEFEAVTQIPYQQLNQTSNGGQLAATAFKDAGIKLDVLPKIAADGTIEMLVRPEFSRLTGFTPGDNQPIIDTRATSTTVRVASGQTFVIGGMRQRSDVGEFAGVPLVKDVRFLGHLFRSRSTNIRESELVVFITPRVVSVAEPLDCREQLIADTLRCRLDHIPHAEGCPPGNCSPPGPGFSPLPVERGVPYETVPPTEMPAPGDNTQSPVQAEPINEGPALEQTSHLSPAPRVPRRLPALDDREVGVTQRVVRMPADPQWRLRPDYDARFRATGGVYAHQQRDEERDSLPEANAPPAKLATTKESVPFWKRPFVR